MAFLQQEITGKQLWLEVDTVNGTEFVPADFVGVPPWMSQGKEYDYDQNGLYEFVADLLQYLSLVHHARHVLSVELVEGYGARLSAPGYLDCTDWSVFDSVEEAKRYLDEEFPEEEEAEEDIDTDEEDAAILEEFEIEEPGHDARLVFEHDRLFVNCPRCGAQWSVHSCVPGPHSFEQLSFGDGYCAEQLFKETENDS